MASAALEIPAAARARDFELLYRRYAQDVYRYALALLRSPADAEDVTQTTFLNAYRAYMRGEEPLKPQNWLIKIAHNAARTRFARASRRVKEVPLDDHVEQLAVSEEDKPDVRAVLEALGRLPLNQRAALAMRELEGRTYAEISELLGVSVAAVETLIFRARRALRLKASAVRTLAAVPLPSPPAQVFDARGVVPGGGAGLRPRFLLQTRGAPGVSSRVEARSSAPVSCSKRLWRSSRASSRRVSAATTRATPEQPRVRRRRQGGEAGTSGESSPIWRQGFEPRVSRPSRTTGR